jgi:hypothetical protein
MKKIKNTAKEEIHPEWLMGGNPSAIENQEAEGQKEGVKFGKPLPDNSIFCNAELPKGWKKRATDHSMWSELVDDKGVVRAQIFYKAAFYDRSAFMRCFDIEGA